MSQAAVDLFGRLLMTKVRDEAVADWTTIVEGRMKGERAAKLRHMLEDFSDNERQAFLSLVPQVVDTVLHHLLWTLEQDDSVRIAISTDGEHVESLRDVSDGLAGELYSDEGWIARFSKQL